MKKNMEAGPAGVQPAGRLPNKRALQKNRTRRAILQAGREVFAARGFEAPNVADLARAAGISRATFYLHYQSREEVMQAVFEREVRWQLRRYRTLTADIVASKRKLLGWAERFIAGFKTERHYVLIIYRALSVDPKNLAPIMRARYRTVRAVARRVPAFRLLGANGKLDRERAIEMYFLTQRLEDVSLLWAFEDEWTADIDFALRSVVNSLFAFARD
jgi:AcrR family transcriptional regulator